MHMHRSTTFRLLAAVAVGLSAAASYAYEVGVACIAAIGRGVDWLFEASVVYPAMDLPQPAPEAKPRVQIVRAVAYRLRRLVRRERVELMPGYRMCPTV